MKKSIFDQAHQHDDIPNKIVASLERISEAFRVLLWNHAKVKKLSPIQIQILIFIAFHDDKLCNVSHLAKEFNLTKATISDAIRVLDKKGMIEKYYSATDKRAYNIDLSTEGKKVLAEIQDFADPVKAVLHGIDEAEQNLFFKTLSKVIYALNRSGILSVQRTCFGCRFYKKRKNDHYCTLMEKDLLDEDIRIDCAEYEARSPGMK